MKLEQLQFFKAEIYKDLEQDIAFEIYYHFNSKWYSLDDGEVSEKWQIHALHAARKEGIAFHAPKSKIAWFFLAPFEAVVSLEFSTSPQAGKRKSYRRNLESVVDRAKNSFAVAHNPLTLLLAKNAFYGSLSKFLGPSHVNVVTDEDAQENAQAQLLAVLAFDIDYFKQVNDTYGHLYGDQVLKTFARRLEAVGAEIERTGQRVKVVVGHPSGEEFLAFIAGNCSKEDILIWAEQFRTKIADEILPSAAEWNDLCSREDLSMVQLPPQQERGIKASIGVAFQVASTTNESIDEAKVLLERADTALYRAKAGGRNQVVAFDNILESWGRVLEHDKDTQVIAIDIGTNVGVVLGQEFKVYSPIFSGSRKFTINDGRTTRTLGLYPRVELTRLTVFNTQPEISFAFISDQKDKEVNIIPGSHLEVIPVGSIGHIIPYRSKYFAANVETNSTDDINALKDYLTEQVSNKKNVYAVVFRFVSDQDYLKKYGSAALNVAITQLYRDIIASVRPLGKIAPIDASSVGIVGMHGAYDEETFKEIVRQFQSDFPELGLTAGVFNYDDLKIIEKASNIKLDPSYGIEFAQFAGSQFGRDEADAINHFTLGVAVKLLKSQFEARSYASGIADFEKLVSLGAVNGSVLNFGGLLYSRSGMKMQAIEQYEAATLINPQVAIYKSNLGLMLRQIGETERALKVFSTLSDEQLAKIIKTHQIGALTYASLLAGASKGGSGYFDTSRFKLLASSILQYDGEFKSSRKRDYEAVGLALEAVSGSVS